MESFEDLTQDATSQVAAAGNDDAVAPEEEDDDDEEEEDEEEGEEDDATAPRNYRNPNDRHLQINAVPTLESLAGLRDLNSDVVCWQLSSAKPGNGVEQILDPSPDTYWQSDGQVQPHWIQVHFSRRVAISHVCLYLDFAVDESYTPKKVSVEAGMTHQDLWEAIPVVELSEPVGWCIFPLEAPPDPLDNLGEDEDYQGGDNKDKRNIVRAHLIRISISSMHQNGRDTHIRKLRLFGPRMTRWPSETVHTSTDTFMRTKNYDETRTRSLEFDNWIPSIR